MMKMQSKMKMQAVAVILGLAALGASAHHANAQSSTKAASDDGADEYNTSVVPGDHGKLRHTQSEQRDAGMMVRGLEIEPAAAGMIRLGKGAEDGFRAEIEFSTRAHDFEPGSSTMAGGVVTGQITTLSVMSNLVWAHRIGMWQPYIGGGVGVARHEVDLLNKKIDVRDSNVVFAYQAMAGVEYPLSEQLSVNFGYRYVETGDADAEGSSIEYATKGAEVGIRVKF